MNIYSFQETDSCIMCGEVSDKHLFLGLRLDKSQRFFPQKKMGIRVSLYKCKKCGLIFPNPIPIPIDIQNHYNIDIDTYWKSNYYKERVNYTQNIINRIQKQYCIKSGSKVLDIGAGLGITMSVFNESGYDCYGVEPSLEFYSKAIHRLEDKSSNLFNTTIEEAIFPENNFDFIYFNAVLEHLKDPSAAILKSLKWLKPGGLLRIQVPSASWLSSKIFNLYYKLRLLPYVSNLSPMHEPFHLYEFSRKTFELHSKINGYQIIDFNYFICDTYMPKIFDPILKTFMKFTNTGMEICVWIKKTEK